MKDFAKSIVCNTKDEVASIESAVVGNYDPNDYKDDPRHKWTVKSIENEIQKYKQRIELNRVRMTQLRNMENSGSYPSATRELKEEQKDYEANQMKVKQLASMLRRATGNSIEEVGNAYQYAGNIPTEKIPDNWRPEFPKAGYIVYYAPNKAKWFATEAEAKKFAEEQDKKNKTGNSRVGNANPVATVRKEDGRYTEIFDDGETITFEKDGKKYGSHKFKDAEEAKRILRTQGYNSKVGNASIPPSYGMLGWDNALRAEYDPRKIVETGEAEKLYVQFTNEYKKEWDRLMSEAQSKLTKLQKEWGKKIHQLEIK